jgi:hypothetical protein
MNNRQRTILTRLLVGYLLIFLLIRFLELATPSNLGAPPLFNLQMDISYWAYKLLLIPNIILGSRPGAVVFDILLLGTAAGGLLFPLRRKWIISFSLLLVLYAMTANSYAMHHTHALAGAMVVLLPLWVPDNYRSWMLWQGVRYYACFLYFVSFCWKAWIGHSLFYWQDGVGTFKMNLVGYLYQNPGTLLAGLYRFCLGHDWILNTGNILISLMEGSMVVGFFTRKWDRTLFWIPVIIHLATYFFSDVWFFELLVLDFAFLSLSQLERLGPIFGQSANSGGAGLLPGGSNGRITGQKAFPPRRS